jgi:hypothetical protein
MFAIILLLTACSGRPATIAEPVPSDVIVAGLNLRASLMLNDDPEGAAPSVLAFAEASARWLNDMHQRDPSRAQQHLELRLAAMADLPRTAEGREPCAGLPSAASRAREHVLWTSAPALQAARECADLPSPPPDGCSRALAKAQAAFLGELGLWLRFLPPGETESVVSGPLFDAWTGLQATAGAQ